MGFLIMWKKLERQMRMSKVRQSYANRRFNGGLTKLPKIRKVKRLSLFQKIWRVIEAIVYFPINSK